MTFARILGITVATSVIVFLGLTYLLPRHHEEKAAAQGVTPDQVFGAQATPPAPGETPAAAPTAPSNPAALAATTTASSETPAAGPAPTDSGAAPASAPSAGTAAAPAQQGLSEEEARKIAEDVGRKVATRVVEEKSSSAPAAESAPAAAAAPAPAPAEPAPSAPAAPAESAPSPSPAPSESASSGSGTTLTESDVRRIAAEEARRVYNQQGGHSSGGVPKKAKSKPVEAPSAAASEPAPSTAAEPAPASPPAAKESTPAKPRKLKSTKAKDMPGDLPASDAISSWWPATDKQSADRLNLVYAGEAAFEKAVVLLFNNPIDASAAASHLQLFGTDGKAVSGTWESGSNPRMLLFKNVKPGRYTVVLAPELADSTGKTLAAGLHGPVYVH